LELLSPLAIPLQAFYKDLDYNIKINGGFAAR
jgi:hypothetical protein